MAPSRRRWLAALLAAAGLPASRADDAPAAHAMGPRTLIFPRDHGAHPSAGIEWWYATGWLQGAADGALLGFQITFFRSRTGLGEGLAGRFVPRQLLFAHAALTDVAAGRHRHAQQMARWSGEPTQRDARAALTDTDVALGRWRLAREGDPARSRYRATLEDPTSALALSLSLTATQPVLLQGDAGWSRKGPLPRQASHYYSQPQLAVQGHVTLDGKAREVAGTGWLDHEWSDELMPPDARGWDWIGINLADGGALTAFRLRRADGSAVWAGGSHRPRGGAVRVFGPQEVMFEPLRRWRSPHSGAEYPVAWRITCPAGRFELRALLDAQELDSRGSTGAVYWEGLSELLDDAARPVGRGYLEMTGYVTPLRL